MTPAAVCSLREAAVAAFERTETPKAMSEPNFTTLDAATMDTATAYRLLVGVVVPRPVAWITTRSKGGVVNAAPFSSYNYLAHSPPMVGVNIGSREGQLKDTARNIVETGEFVVNVATFEAMELMHK